MSFTKIKGSRKRFEASEELLSFSQRASDYARENPHWIIAAVAGVLLIMGIVWGVNSYREANERRARAEYFKIIEEWPTNDITDYQNWDHLVAELQKFSEQHQGTQPALNAQFDLAQAYFHMKRYDESVKAAEAVLKETPPASSLRPLVRYHLALTYEQVGNIDAAMEQWKSLAGSGLKGFEREVSWHLARLYTVKKDYAKAVEQYEAALKAEGSYPSAHRVQQDLEMAKLKAAPASSESHKEAPQAPSKEG